MTCSLGRWHEHQLVACCLSAMPLRNCMCARFQKQLKSESVYTIYVFISIALLAFSPASGEFSVSAKPSQVILVQLIFLCD